jgi:hypothetical protein
MRYYGDIPAIDLRLLEELQTLEKWFDDHGSSLPVIPVAKGMTCVAFDYYFAEFEEEGDRLIRRAEKICPGYFKGPIHVDVEKDAEFAMLVVMLKKTLGYQLIKSLGFSDEQV